MGGVAAGQNSFELHTLLLITARQAEKSICGTRTLHHSIGLLVQKLKIKTILFDAYIFFAL